MRRRVVVPESAPVPGRSLAALVVSAVAVLVAVPPAYAEGDPAPACPDLVPALDAPAGLVTDAGWDLCAAAAAHAAAWAPATDFPGRDGDVAVMTTGSAAQATGQEAVTPGGVALGQATAEPDSGPHGPVEDRSTYRITVDVPTTDNCLGFDYVVGSDEFGQTNPPRFDGLVATIDGDDWRLSDPGFGGWLQFQGGDTFAGGPLLADSPWRDSAAPAADLTYAGRTPVQQAVVGVTPGSHTIRLSVFDGVTQAGEPYNGLRDTGVLLDDLHTWADPEGCASPHNQLPVAGDAGDEQQPLVVFAGGANQLPSLDDQYAFDPDGDQLQMVDPAEQPAHGAVVCVPASCSYTPDEGYTGPDQFRYRVTDGNGGYASAIAWLDVQPDVPVLSGGLNAITQGPTGQLTFTIAVSDSFGDLQPGTLVRLRGAMGNAALTQLATATTAETGVATIQFHPPTTGQWTFQAMVDAAGALPLEIESRWFDLDPVQTLEVTWPAHLYADRLNTVSVRLKRLSGAYATTGSVTVAVGDYRQGMCCFEVGSFAVNGAGVAAVQLQPDAPTDQYEVQIRYDRDPEVFGGGQRLVEEWSGANHAPDVLGEQLDAVAHQPLALDLAANDLDADGDLLTYAVVTPPQHGTLACEADGACVYRPGGHLGADAFVYSVTDGLSPAVEATVDLTVQAAPAPSVTLGPATSVQSVRGKVTLSGKVTPASAGAPLQLQRLDGSTWTTIARRTLTTGASVPYLFSVASTTSRSARYRVVLPSYDGRLGRTSATATIGWQAAALVAHRATGREWVQVRNTGKVAIGIRGWTVRTRAGFVLRLPTRTLVPGASVRVYVGRVARLGDRHDVLTLRNPRGVTAAVRRY
jgi:hypothetical protein